MTLVEALADLQRALGSRGAQDLVSIEHKTLAGVRRVELTRRTDNFSRYVQFHEVDEDDAPWEYMFLFGEYGGNNDTDGRRGGDRGFLVRFTEAWLVDLCSQDDLPHFELPP